MFVIAIHFAEINVMINVFRESISYWPGGVVAVSGNSLSWYIAWHSPNSLLRIPIMKQHLIFITSKVCDTNIINVFKESFYEKGGNVWRKWNKQSFIWFTYWVRFVRGSSLKRMLPKRPVREFFLSLLHLLHFPCFVIDSSSHPPFIVPLPKFSYFQFRASPAESVTEFPRIVFVNMACFYLDGLIF